MAEEQDSHEESQKTEEATAHRLTKAREEGQIAISREVYHWTMILGLFLCVAILAPPIMSQVLETIKPLLMAGDIPPMEGTEIMGLMQAVLLGSLKPMLLIFLVFIVGGLGAGFAQTQFLISAESIKPKLSKLSIFQGVKRIFSLQSIVEFMKGIGKLVIVGSVFMVVLYPYFQRLNQWSNLPAGRVFEVIQQIMIQLLMIVLAVLGVIVGLDYLYQRFAFMKKMRMTKQQVKEEHKETEGDPLIKQRLSQLRRERTAQQRISTAVPEASVVITNPTHYAVALKYTPDDMDAPKCVAKGADLVALSIRRIVEENDVPIIEDPPLARALFAGIEVDEEVPEKYYSAVARVIRYIMGMDKVYAESELVDEEEGAA